MLMLRQLRARLETHQRRAPLSRLVFPYGLLTDAWEGFLPSQLGQGDCARWWRGADFLGGRDASADERENCRSVDALHRVDAAVRTIARVARRHRAVIITEGALDHIQQLVAVMPMHRETA